MTAREDPKTRQRVLVWVETTGETGGNGICQKIEHCRVPSFREIDARLKSRLVRFFETLNTSPIRQLVYHGKNRSGQPVE